MHIFERYPERADGPYEAFIAFGGEENRVYRRRAAYRTYSPIYNFLKWFQIHVPFGKHQMSGSLSVYQIVDFSLADLSRFTPADRHTVLGNLHKVRFVTFAKSPIHSSYGVVHIFGHQLSLRQ